MGDVSNLFFAAAPEAPEHINVLLYGPPGSGKSTAAATAPGPILWVNAEGPNALAYARKTAAERGTQILEVRLERGQDIRQTLHDVLAHVRSGADPVPQTVVVDTIGKVREGLIKQLVSPGAKNSLQQFGEVARVLGEFVRFLRDEPVNLVVLAHREVADADGGDRIVRPLIGGALTESVPADMDIEAFCARITVEDEPRYVGQFVEERGREAKDRSGGLGKWRELDLGEWFVAFRDALTPADPLADAAADADDDAADGPDVDAGPVQPELEERAA